jgi:uncharacterized BrkB/YihY/UPF0761 family membrane protein
MSISEPSSEFLSANSSQSWGRAILDCFWKIGLLYLIGLLGLGLSAGLILVICRIAGDSWDMIWRCRYLTLTPVVLIMAVFIGYLSYWIFRKCRRSPLPLVEPSRAISSDSA